VAIIQCVKVIPWMMLSVDLATDALDNLLDGLQEMRTPHAVIVDAQTKTINAADAVVDALAVLRERLTHLAELTDLAERTWDAG